ncbi:MAG TPA: ABC transporter substrate-binding protein [Chloroflexota bacterium]|nr:ABC transporter substrate-binding protein [Chloroflexota bacterium]
MISRRRVLVGGLATVLLAACGGAASPTAAPTTAPSKPPEKPTSAPAATPVSSAASPAATGAAAAATKPAAATAAATPAAGATSTGASATSTAATPAAKPAGSPAAATSAGGSAKIGAALSITKDAAVYGATQKNGIQLAQDELNEANAAGVKLDVLIEDDASDKTQGINVFNKFINQDKVLAIIGPTLSNTAQATDPIAQQAQVPVLGVSNTAGGITSIGNYIFRDSLTEAQVIPQTIKAVKTKLNIAKAAIIYGNDDAFTKAGYDEFKKALQANGIQITSEQTFAKGDKDFSAQLTQIKGTNPDAIVVSALAEEGTGILQQGRRLGIDPKVPFVGGNGLNSPAVIKNAGGAAEGTIVGAAWNAASPNPKSQDFIKKYTAKYNSAPDQFAAQAYAGMYILAEGIKRAGAPDRAKLRDALATIKDFDTVLGKFSFTADRDADHPAIIQIVKGDHFEVFA